MERRRLAGISLRTLFQQTGVGTPLGSRLKPTKFNSQSLIVD